MPGTPPALLSGAPFQTQHTFHLIFFFFRILFLISYKHRNFVVAFLGLLHTVRFISFATAFFDNFFSCDLRLFVHMVRLDLYKIHIGIAHHNHIERVWNPFMCDIAHTNLSQSHHMNSLININTTHFYRILIKKNIAPRERALKHFVESASR